MPDGCQFQITLPIHEISRAHAELRPAHAHHVDVVPCGRTKAAEAAGRALDASGAGPHEVRLSLHSSLPVGAGLGSSTADIVATIHAIADALGTTTPPVLAGEIAGGIEASDGTMFDGITIVDRRGRLLQPLTWWPSFHVVVLVPERTVETAAVDLRSHRGDAGRYQELVDQVIEGSERRDPAAFVDAAKASAALNQRLMPNPLLVVVPRLAALTGALGWNVAHTGSAVGLLYDDATLAAAAPAILRGDGDLTRVRLLSSTVPSPAESGLVEGRR